MSKYNAIKSEQLGMSFSTASNRLRKMLMFQLIQQLEKDICHRCEKRIENVEEMSIEHIEDWLHSENPKGLFFDLNNITFSHLSCNCSENRMKYRVGSSGLKGVDLHDRRSKKNPWRASIQITENGKRKFIYIGQFSTREEAGREYDKKAIELLGDKAITNESLGLL